MKNLCLENYGVSRLETQEKKTIDGGNPWVWAILVGAVVNEIIGDWDHFKAGLYAGFCN